jgi:hypothetical protein
MARRDAEGRGHSGSRGPHGARTPTGDPDAPATRRKAGGAAPVGIGPVTHLRLQALHRAPAERTRQAADPSQRRSSARMSPVARGPRVPGSVAESVSRVAPTADRVLPRRSVIVSSHLTASTDARRDSRDRRHGDLDRLPPRADRHAGGPRAAGSDSLSGHAACTPWNGENSRDQAQNVRVDSSVRPRGKLPAVVIGQALVPRTQLPPQHPILFDQVRQYLPLLAVQPARDGQEQHAESRDVDHGQERTALPSFWRFTTRSAETWDPFMKRRVK